jgi:parvulin-like peptidyl-prolyl isomerase
MSSRLLALLAAALLALGAAACGGGDDEGGGGGAESSADVPSGAVATVGGAEIRKNQLDAQVAALVRAQRGGGDKLTPAVRRQLEAQALSTLLMRRALEQEAADRDVRVRRAEVRKRWKTISRSQFKTKKALRRFLGGQTERDLIDQLRLQTLTERIHEDVRKEAGGGKEGAKAVKDFQADFQKRLQERTACRQAYAAAAGCSGD